jgi:hypothetical protein
MFNNTSTTSRIIDTNGIDISRGQATTRNPRLQVTSVKSRKGGTVMDAHRQWATRPADEAVYTFDELLSRTRAMQSHSLEMDAQRWNALRIEPGERALSLVSDSIGQAKLSAWSIRQLCAVIDAPADYVTRLPSQIAAALLTYGLHNDCKRTGSASMLAHTGPNDQQIRSITSTRYERVWDAEIAEMADSLQRNGSWGPCEAFKVAGGGQTPRAWSQAKRLPLGWVGDRSTFIALADYESPVTINGAQLARFALLSNSEVGAQGLKIVFGLMDFACANFILWGCQQVTEVTARHVGSVRARFAQLTEPMKKRLTSEQRGYLTSGLNAAQRYELGDTKDEVLAAVVKETRLPKAHVERAYEIAEGTPRYGNPRSAWGMLSGLTEASQELHENADKRTAADVAAAKIMDLVR